jgi:hypothetical protein
VLIRHGRLQYDGGVERAIGLHYESLSNMSEQGQEGIAVEVRERLLVGGEGEDHHANYDQPMELDLRLRFRHEVEDPEVEFSIRMDGGIVAMTQTHALDPHGGIFRGGDEVSLRIRFRARLGAGSYRLAVWLRTRSGELLGGCDGPVLFVAGRPGSVGVIDLRARIDVDGHDRTDRRLTLLGTSVD